jgi:hypothetical protein
MCLAGKLDESRGLLQGGLDIGRTAEFIQTWQDAMDERQGLAKIGLRFGQGIAGRARSSG